MRVRSETMRMMVCAYRGTAPARRPPTTNVATSETAMPRELIGALRGCAVKWRSAEEAGLACA